jgi:hypothetical protein
MVATTILLFSTVYCDTQRLLMHGSHGSASAPWSYVSSWQPGSFGT